MFKKMGAGFCIIQTRCQAKNDTTTYSENTSTNDAQTWFVHANAIPEPVGKKEALSPAVLDHPTRQIRSA